MTPDEESILLHIRKHDPDGQATAPTEEDYTRFDNWVIENFGKDTLDRYNGNWDERSTE